MSWQSSFVAMTVALGISPDEAWSALGAAEPAAAALTGALKNPERAERAKALAAQLTAIARDVDALDDGRPA